MKYTFSHFHKPITSILIVSLIFPAALFMQPKKSEAAITTISGCAGLYSKKAVDAFALAAKETAAAAVSVPVNSTVANQYIALTAGSVSSLDAKENCYDSIFWFLAKILISRITQSIVNWINSGFQGSPTFVQDLGGFLQDTADEEFVHFMAAAFPDTADALDLLCSPFKLEIKAALNLKYNSYFNNTQQCGLSDIIQNVKGATGSVDAFIGGDFSQGGWGGWYSLTQNPENNKYGAYLQAEEELATRIVTAQGKEIKLLEFGKGFHSITQTLADGTKQIVTPGTAIEARLAAVTTSDIRQLELADEFNEIMAALFGQLISKAFSAGGSLFAAGDRSNGSSEADGVGNGGFDDNGDIQNPNSDPLPDTVPDPTSNTPQNVTREKIATQSSNYRNDTPAVNAIDGNTFGSQENLHAVTDPSIQPWWQVDLRESYNITEIRVWPRLSTRAGTITNNFYVLVSDSPLTGTLSQLLARADVQKHYISGEADVPEFVTVNATGRYVKIQLASTEARWLELAEVQVYATKIAPFVGPLPTATP